MTDPKLEPNEGESPETDSGPQHIEVAPPAVADAPPPAPAAPPAVRNVPEHFSLLFGLVCVFVGAMSVWEREHIFGMEIEGPDKIAGAILLALSGYAGIIAILNVLQGRMRGVVAMFTTAFFALYFGGPAIYATIMTDGFVTMEEFKAVQTASDSRQPPPVPDRFRVDGFDIEFPDKTIDAMPRSWQTPIQYSIGQFGPGPLLTTFGGLLILWVFLKGIFGGKKKAEPAPAPSSSGRRRRR